MRPPGAAPGSGHRADAQVQEGWAPRRLEREAPVTLPALPAQDPWPPGMSQRHSDSALEEKLLERRFHSELRLDAHGNPAPQLPVVRGSLQPSSNAALEPKASTPSGDKEPPRVVLSTQSPAALKMGTQQMIPRNLAVASRAKAPARHQSFGAAVLSKEASRRDPQLLPAPSFSLDDMDVHAGPAALLKRNLRNQSYRAAMRGLEVPCSKGDSLQLSAKLQALSEESSQPPTRCPAKNKVGACLPGGQDGEVPSGRRWPDPLGPLVCTYICVTAAAI